MGMNGMRARKALLGMALAMGCQAALAQAIEEIVVTSRRQGEEKLMETPLAITAFDSNAIESKGITNLQDVANLTPGLSFFNPLGESLPTPVIRGVVPQDIFGENAAAIFIDGVYVAGREGLNFSQLDIARIEVMKGPQSSTYGRNAFSGAINYITTAPSDVFESKLEGDIGNRGKQKVMAQVSGPIWGETLTGRASVLYDEWDGSYDNTLVPESDIGGYRYRSYQGKLRWRPTDGLDVNLAVYRSNDEIDDFAAGGLLANCEPKVKQTSADVAATAPGSQRMQEWCGRVPRLREMPQALDAATFDTALYPGPLPLAGSIRRDGMPKVADGTGEHRNLTRGNLNVAWDTDYGTLTSLTGYSYMKEYMVNDFNRLTGNAMPLVYCQPSSNADPAACTGSLGWGRIPVGVIDIEPGPQVEEWSQEIRFTSPRDQRLRWQAGGYYFHSVLKDRKGNPAMSAPLPSWFNYLQGGNVAVPPLALPTNLAIGSYIFAASFDPYAGLDPLDRPFLRSSGESWSVFGSMDFDITEKLKTRLELRYTQDHRWAEAYSFTKCGPPAGSPYYPWPMGDRDIANCGNAFFDLRVLDAVDHTEWIKDNSNVYQPVTVPGVKSGSARFDNTTGRIGLDYKLDSGRMVYGSVAYGEKPGGINMLTDKEVVDHTGGVGLTTIVNRFGPEKMTAWELGIKGYTPDRRIRFDLSVFFNDWRDVVLRQLTEVDPVSGMLFRQPQGLNVNSGDAHVFGWELTTDVGLTESLTGRLTVGYTDSKMKNGKLDSYALFPSFYTSEADCAPAAIQALPVAAQAAQALKCQHLGGDISGTTQMRQPQWTASLSLDYKHQLVGDWDLKSSLSGNFTDKMYTGNDNLGWVPARAVANFNIGVESPRYTLQLWVRNLFNDDKPLSGYRDIFWGNDSDMYAKVPTGSGSVRNISNFDDFPMMRLTVSYPSLRTWGLTARMRFGGAEK